MLSQAYKKVSTKTSASICKNIDESFLDSIRNKYEHLEWSKAMTKPHVSQFVERFIYVLLCSLETYLIVFYIALKSDFVLESIVALTSFSLIRRKYGGPHLSNSDACIAMTILIMTTLGYLSKTWHMSAEIDLILIGFSIMTARLIGVVERPDVYASDPVKKKQFRHKLERSGLYNLLILLAVHGYLSRIGYQTFDNAVVLGFTAAFINLYFSKNALKTREWAGTMSKKIILTDECVKALSRLEAISHKDLKNIKKEFVKQTNSGIQYPYNKSCS